MYIGSLHHTTREETLINFLQKNGITGDIQCEMLETKGRNKSFKFGLPLGELDKVKSSEFWPKGVAIRRFNFRRQGRTGVEL